MHGCFPKRSYTWRGLVQDVTRLLSHGSRAAWRASERWPSREFMERVMLAVTAVNGCRYCSWVHLRAALKAGASRDSAIAILGGNMSHHDEKEAVAPLFAQHHAATGGNPGREHLKALVSALGARQASRILLVIAGITIGNLAGNTVDAFSSRLRGIPAVPGSRMLEMLFFIVGKPLVLLAGMR